MPTGCQAPGTARGPGGGQGGPQGGSGCWSHIRAAPPPDPPNSRQRVVLPSKEMRSLPCAAHLGSPRCYFYVTFQARFLFPAVLL